MRRTLGQEPAPRSCLFILTLAKEPRRAFLFLLGLAKARPALAWGTQSIYSWAFLSPVRSQLEKLHLRDASRASNCSVLKQIRPWARGCQPQLCKGLVEQGVWRIVQLTESGERLNSAFIELVFLKMFQQSQTKSVGSVLPLPKLLVFCFVDFWGMWLNL